MNALLIITSSLVSGIIGVLISIFYHKHSDKKRAKMDVLRNFVAYRHDVSGDNFTKTLNEIFVVFPNSPDIHDKVKNLHETLSSRQDHLVIDRLYELFKAMCNDLGIDTSKIEQSSFIRAFNLKK